MKTVGEDFQTREKKNEIDFRIRLGKQILLDLFHSMMISIQYHYIAQSITFYIGILDLSSSSISFGLSSGRFISV